LTKLTYFIHKKSDMTKSGREQINQTESRKNK